VPITAVPITAVPKTKKRSRWFALEESGRNRVLAVEAEANDIIQGSGPRLKLARSRYFLLRPGLVGEWLSLVEHLVRDQGVGGSNPLSPTIFSSTCSKFIWVQLAIWFPHRACGSLDQAGR
jgi:hypothetical protein